MAENVVKGNELIEDDAFKSTRESVLSTITAMRQMVAVFEQVIQLSKTDAKNNTLDSSESIGRQTKALNEVTAAAKAKLDLDNKIVQAEAQFKTVMDETTGGISRQHIELAKLRLGNAEATKQAKELAKEELGLNNAYQKKSKTLNDLRNEYKNLAAQNQVNTKEAKAMLAQINALDKELKKIDATVGQHQRSVGNYSDALNRLPGMFGQVGSGLQGLGTRFGIVGAALAIVVSLFSKFEPLVEFLERKIAALSAVWSIFSDRISQFGTGLKDIVTGNFGEGINEIGSAFTGMGTAMGKAATEAERLKGELQDLEDMQGIVNVVVAKNEKIAAIYDKQSRDRTKSFAERRTLLEKALDTEKLAFDIESDQNEALYRNKIDAIAAAHQIEYKSIIELALTSREYNQQLRDQYTGIGKDLDELAQMRVTMEKNEKQSAQFQETRMNKLNALRDLEIEQNKKLLEDSEKKRTQAIKDNQQNNLDLAKGFEKAHTLVIEGGIKDREEAEKEAKEAREKQAKVDAISEANYEKGLADEKKKRDEQRKESEKQMFDQLKSWSDEYYANEEKQIDRSIDASKQRQSELRALAQSGVDNAADSIAQEQANQARLEEERKKTERKKMETEAAIAILKDATARMENGEGPAIAFGKAGLDVLGALAVAKTIPSFKEGTENTGILGGPGIDGMGGRAAILHDEEAVLTREQNLKRGELPLDDLVNLGAMYNSGLLVPNIPQSYSQGSSTNEVVKELREIKREVKENRSDVNFNYDAISDAFVKKVETRTKITNFIKPAKGIW